MKGKIISLLLIALFLMWCFSNILFASGIEPEMSGIMTNLFSSIFCLTGTIWLFYTGTFRISIYFRFIFFAIALLLVGILFKIQHWEEATMLISIASAGCFTIYLLHYISKKEKKLLDNIKLLWVILVAVTLIITVNKLSYSIWARSITYWIFLALIALKIIGEQKSQQTINPKISDEKGKIFN